MLLIGLVGHVVGGLGSCSVYGFVTGSFVAMVTETKKTKVNISE